MRTELMWAAHNLIAHPLSEVCYWLGKVFPAIARLGEWLHEITIPTHEPGTGRG